MNINDKTYDKLLEMGYELDQITHAELELSQIKTEFQEVAKKILNLCHEARPKDPKPLEWLAMVYIHTRKKEDLDKAEKLYKKVYEMKDDSRNLQAELGLGNVYRLKDEFEKAIKYYKKALKRREHPVIYSNIALTYDKWSKRNKAVEWAKKGLKVLNEKPEEYGEQTKKELEEIRDTGLDWNKLYKEDAERNYESESKKKKYKK